MKNNATRGRLSTRRYMNQTMRLHILQLTGYGINYSNVEYVADLLSNFCCAGIFCDIFCIDTVWTG